MATLLTQHIPLSMNLVKRLINSLEEAYDMFLIVKGPVFDSNSVFFYLTVHTSFVSP